MLPDQIRQVGVARNLVYHGISARLIFRRIGIGLRSLFFAGASESLAHQVAAITVPACVDPFTHDPYRFIFKPGYIISACGFAKCDADHTGRDRVSSKHKIQQAHEVDRQAADGHHPRPGTSP